MTQITAEYIDHMGSDMSVVRAARVSFASESETYGVEKLIRYLAKHHHWTPFAHTSITFRVSAPVPIRTQCFKHKQGFVENEESRRYISSEPEVYFPDVWREAPPTGGAKQGSGGRHALQETWTGKYSSVAGDALTLYREMIREGVSPEQARFILPQGCIVNWYWTGSLAAFARFYSQRTDPHAQQEIQGLARIIGAKLADLFPVSWKELTA